MTDSSISEQEAVKAILHRARTRALRDAPVYLEHIYEIEQEFLALLERTAIETRRESGKRVQQIHRDFLTHRDGHRSQQEIVALGFELTAAEEGVRDISRRTKDGRRIKTGWNTKGEML